MRLILRLVLIFSFSLFLPASAYALELANQSSNIFKFQQKLATKGNARAQYKLACMYEFGTGIEQSFERAQHWYRQASNAGIKAASDRMSYLLIRKQGYDNKKNSAWLDGIKKAAKESKGDAMFLLAQLYREGLGVKKDLNKAMEILDQVSLLGAADVEKEMALIQQELEARDIAKENAGKKHKIEIAGLAKSVASPGLEQQANIEQRKISQNAQRKAVQSSKQRQRAQQVELEKAVLAAKRQRYVKAMMKLKLEQQKIDEQQAWAEGGDMEAATADDEI